jgi:hypothetical protein
MGAVEAAGVALRLGAGRGNRANTQVNWVSAGVADGPSSGSMELDMVAGRVVAVGSGRQHNGPTRNSGTRQQRVWHTPGCGSLIYAAPELGADRSDRVLVWMLVGHAAYGRTWSVARILLR